MRREFDLAMPGYADWRDFFLGAASAGAALTGLVFVAISLHPKQIATTPLLRARASGALIGFVNTMLVGLVVLVPAGAQRVAELALGLFGVISLGYGFWLQFRRLHHRLRSTLFLRWFLMGIGTALVAVGGFGLAVATPAGAPWLYVLLAAACFVFLGNAVFQCWLLVLQIDENDAAIQRAG